MTAKTESAETLRAGVGTFLKKYRESKGMSQRDVANKLGYRNINFMSMMEKGGSALPPNRIMEIVNAYCIPQEVSGGIFSLVYEDLWASVVNCLCAGATPEEAEVIKRVDAKCQKNFANIAADFDK
jgi:transcriptional regulator with XRE-family HTH domain